MDTKKKLIVLSLLLLISITNYVRQTSELSVRPVSFLSIFAIGAISGLLFQEIVLRFKSR